MLGRTLASDLGGARVSGIIVETEAYLGVHDPASHAWQGRRRALYRGIWGDDSHWYVYRSYGLHWCVNITAPTAGDAGAVLIRAVTPSGGIDVMHARRGAVSIRQLTNGPGKLTQAFGITDAQDGTRATSRGVLRITGKTCDDDTRVRITERIGITRAADWPLRFLLDPPALRR